MPLTFCIDALPTVLIKRLIYNQALTLDGVLPLDTFGET
jgi:hypothetical protein